MFRPQGVGRILPGDEEWSKDVLLYILYSLETVSEQAVTYLPTEDDPTIRRMREEKELKRYVSVVLAINGWNGSMLPPFEG